MNKGSQIALKVYKECGIVSPFDIPIEDVAFARGAVSKREYISGAEGRIIFKNNSAVITVSKSITYEPRIRFILAHELGHFEMHSSEIKVFDDNDVTLNEWFKKGSQETEANQFAAEYLMPTNLFKSKCTSTIFNPSKIFELSAFFKTSLIATAIRYADLNIYPVCIYYCVDNIVKWFHPATDFPYWSRDLARLNVPTGSVAAEFFADGTIYESDDIQEVLAHEWLDDKTINNEMYINEFCFTSEQYNSALSIIWES